MRPASTHKNHSDRENAHCVNDAFRAEYLRVIRELQRAETLRARCFMVISLPAVIYLFLFLGWAAFSTHAGQSGWEVYWVYAAVTVGGNGVLLLFVPIGLFFRYRRKANALQNVLAEMSSYEAQTFPMQRQETPPQ